MDINLPLTKGQAEFMRRYDEPLVIMHTSIAYGKSYIAAMYLITEMLKGRKCLAGAQTHSAIRKVLFTHMRNICRKIGVNYSENKTDRSIAVGSGITFAFSNESPDECLGMSECDCLVMDEASRLSEEFYNNMKSRLRGGLDVTHTRLITSPNEAPSARWFNNIIRTHSECVITGSMYENVFLSDEYIKDMEEMYGIGTPLYKRQVLGIPLEGDYLNAIVRIEDFAPPTNFSPMVTPRYMGMDLSGMGRDKNAIVTINNTGLLSLKTYAHLDSIAQAGLVKDSMDEFGWRAGAFDHTGGYGQGMYDNVKHMPRFKCLKPVTFSETPSNNLYANVRTEMYMELAKCIRDGFYIDQHAYPELIEELRNTQSFINEKGIVHLIPKEQIKKEIGRSPDSADALALAVYAMNHYGSFNIKEAMRNAEILQSMGYFSNI